MALTASPIRKPAPLEVADLSLCQFWWDRINYTPSRFSEPVHKALLTPVYDEAGSPQPTLVMLAGGEQAGKSKLGADHIFGMHWFGKIVWIVGERYEDCTHEFEYLTEHGIRTGVLDPRNVSFPQGRSARATFSNGLVIRTLSSGDATTLAGESPDGILMVEAGRQTYQAFRTLWIRAHHNTGWFLVSGTFEATKGRWYPDLWKQLQSDNEFHGHSFSLPTYANSSKYPEGENDPKVAAARKTMSEEEFAERFLGQPRSTIGVVFPEFRRATHVRNSADFDPGYPVRLWVDPGYYPSSYAVLFVQVIGGQTRIFDEIYVNHLVNDQVLDIVVNHPRFPAVEKVVIDVASKQHAGAQEPSLSSWQKRLAGIPITGKFIKIDDGLKRTHDKLRTNPLTGEPYMILHPRCDHTIEEFEEGYRYPVHKDGEIGASSGPIDKNNHAMKALAYGLIDTFGMSDGVAASLKPTKRRSLFHW